MGLRDKYAYAIQTAKGKFDGNAQERDGKLYWNGTVKTEAEANEIWTAIKTIPDWRNEIVADIKVTGLVDGRFCSKSASFFEVLLDVSPLVMDVQGRDHPIGDHTGSEGR